MFSAESKVSSLPFFVGEVVASGLVLQVSVAISRCFVLFQLAFHFDFGANDI